MRKLSPTRARVTQSAARETNNRRKRPRDTSLARRISLLAQVMSILHLSAVCARAVTVIGAVISPTAAVTAAANGHDGTAATDAAATAASSPAAGRSFAVAPTRRRTTSSSSPHAFVSSRPAEDKEAFRSGRTAGRLHAASHPDKRRMGFSLEARISARNTAATAAFVRPPPPPPGLPSARHVHCQRFRHLCTGGDDFGRCARRSWHSALPQRSSCSRSCVTTAPGVGVCATSRGGRLIGMSFGVAAAAAAAAFLAAAQATASAAARVSCSSTPSGYGSDGVESITSRSRPALGRLRALATGASGSNEPDSTFSCDGGDKSGNGRSGADLVVLSPMGALQVLLGLFRWLQPRGRVNMKRQRQRRQLQQQRRQRQEQTSAAAATATASSDVQRRDGLLQACFLRLLEWMWWPFACLEGVIAGKNSRRRSRRVPRGSGGREWDERGPTTAQPGGSEPRAMLRPTLSVQEVQRAYARPQSTAYPRPKVTTRTLLDLDVEEEEIETLPTRKERLALAGRRVNGAAAASPKRAARKDPLLSKLLVRFFEWVITSRARVVEGLEVCVDARSNREAMSGLLQSVGITFNHLELETLQISGGARMNITGLDLKVMTLLWKRFESFKKPFEVEGSYVFTSGDLASSPMVRRLVTNMMNATLRKLEMLATEPLRNSSITIKQVTAKRSRLVIDGDMAYDNARVPFTYRTSIGVKGQGHVVYLKDAEVFWENVGGSLALPLLPLETFDVDMGEGARIESIRIVNGQVALKARVVISPFPPLMVASVRKRAAFRFDVAERVSVAFGNLVQNMKILRFQFRPNQT